MTTAVARFPGSYDKSRFERARKPLQTVVAAMLVVDLIGLGLHFAGAVDSPFTDEAPTKARTRVSGAETVVSGSLPTDATGATKPAGRSAEAVGCLALSSGCYPGDTVAAPPQAGGTTASPSAPTSPNTPGTTPQPVPAAQLDLAVPALDTQVSVGIGEGGCTSLELTVIAVGECDAEGDGAVLLNLGGSLLGD